MEPVTQEAIGMYTVQRRQATDWPLYTDMHFWLYTIGGFWGESLGYYVVCRKQVAGLVKTLSGWV